MENFFRKRNVSFHPRNKALNCETEKLKRKIFATSTCTLCTYNNVEDCEPSAQAPCKLHFSCACLLERCPCLVAFPTKTTQLGLQVHRAGQSNGRKVKQYRHFQATFSQITDLVAKRNSPAPVITGYCRCGCWLVGWKAAMP